jgi:hypothetical protein
MQTQPELMDEKSLAPKKVILKVYEKPKLEILGDVRAITLGGSDGVGESGGKAPMIHS